MTSKRLDAVKLAKSSRWDELRRLVDVEPLTAQQVDSYGMLPLHWACTEPQSISEGVLLALLKAYPMGARVLNTAEMLPLQIAIKAQGRIEWLQALLASYPDAVLKKTPNGENPLELGKKAGLPYRSIKLLEEMYHHVCAKEGIPDQLMMEEQEVKKLIVKEEEDEEGGGGRGGRGGGKGQEQEVEEELRPSERFQAIAGDLPVYQKYSNGIHYGQQRPRRMSSTASLKMRSFSDNEFYTQQMNVMFHANGSSPWSPRRTVTESVRPQSIVSQRPSTTVRGTVSLPPRWMNAPNCSICSQKFGTFKKRHHCRNCGQSICRDHSARERMKLPHYGLNDRHRVCVVCHDMLRNASRQMNRQQTFMPTIQRVGPHSRVSQTFGGDARRSDEAQRSPPGMLERHVSAPARASNSIGVPYRAGNEAAVNEQVANLQKQVSQLMEEKQQAEMQLRAQAEMLNDPDRLTNVSRSSNTSGGSGAGSIPMSRDRQSSLPMPMHTNSSGSATPCGGPVPNPGISMYRSTGQLLYKTRSAGNFRLAREIDIDSPDFDNLQLQQQQQQQRHQQSSRSNSNPVNPALQRTTRLQDALNTIAAVESTYDDIDGSDSDSDIEGRQTDIEDLHDADAEIDDVVTEYVIDDEEEEDDDDDEEAVVEAAKAATVAASDEVQVAGEVGGDTLPEVDVLVSLGHVMMEKGSVSAAVQAFTRAVEIRPDDPALHSLLGRAYYADENLDAAVASITKSLSLEPSATNSTLLGKILFEKGDHEKAIAAYQRSLDMQK